MRLPLTGVASVVEQLCCKEDQIVEWVKPKVKPVWMTDAPFAALPPTLRVRELRYRIVARGMRTREVTIATARLSSPKSTLLDSMRYPKREIAKLYGLRWEIETHFRHLKTTMKMEHLKCQSVDGVLKELMVFVLVYNLVRAAMALAAQRQGINDANRMSFVDALRWLCAMQATRPGAAMPDRESKSPRPPQPAREETTDEGVRSDEQAAKAVRATISP